MAEQEIDILYDAVCSHFMFLCVYF